LHKVVAKRKKKPTKKGRAKTKGTQIGDKSKKKTSKNSNARNPKAYEKTSETS